MEAVGRLAGGIAHDFNNQLTVVLGYCDMLLGQMRPDDPLRSWVEEILKASQRSETLTSRLLTFSRKQIMHPEVINLHQVIGDLRALLGRVIGEDIDLRMSFPDDLGHVTADRSLLEQALMNLVVNARDAMPRGGILAIETANAWLDEAYAAAHPEVVPGAYVAVTVTDTGIGMDRETLQRIFDPFFTTKPVGQGTGLGLPMAYGFVKQSGGRIPRSASPAAPAAGSAVTPVHRATQRLARALTRSCPHLNIGLGFAPATARPWLEPEPSEERHRGPGEGVAAGEAARVVAGGAVRHVRPLGALRPARPPRVGDEPRADPPPRVRETG
jgi:C4-dicarboxylate-specific signal transduction histidine kinase